MIFGEKLSLDEINVPWKPFFTIPLRTATCPAITCAAHFRTDCQWFWPAWTINWTCVDHKLDWRGHKSNLRTINWTGVDNKLNLSFIFFCFEISAVREAWEGKSSSNLLQTPGAAATTNKPPLPCCTLRSTLTYTYTCIHMYSIGLYVLHCVLCTLLYPIHSMYNIVCYTLYMLYWILCTLHTTLNTMYCIENYTLYVHYCILCTIFFVNKVPRILITK